MNEIPIGAPITIISAIAVLCGQRKHYKDPGQLGADLWEHYYYEARTEAARGGWIATDHASIDLLVEIAGQQVVWHHEKHAQWHWASLGNPPIVKPENPFYYSLVPNETALVDLQGTNQHPHAPLARLFTAIDRNAVAVAALLKIAYARGSTTAYDDYAVLRLWRGEEGCLAQGTVGFFHSTAAGDTYRELYDMEVDPYAANPFEGRGDHVGAATGRYND